MNIIRTPAVELTTIPAIAYKMKLASGGAGLKIFRLDTDQSAVFTLDKRTGSTEAFGKMEPGLFPDEAIEEALELTDGLPYSSRGKIKVTSFEIPNEEEDVTEEQPEAIDMVDSPEYEAIVERYTDEKGKMNYRLMNKDFIQFAAKSTVVSKMVNDRESEDDILAFIVGTRANNLSGRKEALSKEEACGLMETLDEIDPRGAFKELKAYIRRLSSKAK